MRRPLFRYLLALALALAMPLQGFAAAAGGACMALGHHDAPAAHGHDEDHGDSHAHGHEQGQPAESPAHCPPCTACCASAAIAPSAPLLVAGVSSHVLNAAAPPSLAGVQPETLDRPPLAL